MAAAVPKTLILYSCPGDQDRIRLDKEHRALDELLRKHDLPGHTLRRLHATTVSDFTSALRDETYEIVHFSGHGSPEGICLEDDLHGQSVFIDADRVSRIIQAALPDLRLALFASCYSASAIPVLINAAPFLITMQGTADDEAAIQFISNFYDDLFRHGAFERAFNTAMCSVEFRGKADRIKPILSRRAKQRKGAVIQASVGARRDSIFVDLTEAEPDIAALNIPKDDFLSLLTRKIRLHEWIFRYPRENALLSIGPYFGFFSWTNADDIVTCTRLMQLKSNVDEATCNAWTKLIVTYNDRRCEKHRAAQDPGSPENTATIARALERLHKNVKSYLDDPQLGEPLRKAARTQFAVSFTNALSNVESAEEDLRESDFPSAAIKFEVALSAIHDLINALAAVLTEQPAP
ncbi:MAG: CHAT domain-containing protein [Verrucomicrobia bacterium]|nr:CHAT domain-containing protein [Verrucomicrobiota bacterium]